MKAAVVGLGKIGLPLAVQIAGSGITTVGCDIDPGVVELVTAGKPPFPGEAELETRLQSVVEGGLLKATGDTTVGIAGADVVIIVVPLVVDGNGIPDFRAMDSATAAVAAGLSPGQLVVYETTLPVHSTRNRFAVALEQATGMQVGVDFHVVHSPERVFSGRIFSDLRRYPKLVGGITPQCASRAIAFYEAALQFDPRPDLPRPNGVWDLGSAEAAELAKLAETTYRDVNIALANEFALYAERVGIDIHQVIDAANSQPFSHVHRPGIAVGGHCIPVYPRFYLAGDPGAQLPRVARDVNERMPTEAVQRLATALGGLAGRRVVVLGASYRGGVKETAFSGVFPLVRQLEDAGAVATVVDPLYSADELEGLGLTAHRWGDHADAVVVQADDPTHQELGPADFPGVAAVYDGRGALPSERWGGVTLLVVGKPDTR